MIEDQNRLDGVIDEALRALTDGAPAGDLRSRVIARLGAEAEPASSGHPGALSLRTHPIRWAAVVALAVLALTGALVVPKLVQPGSQTMGDTARVSQPTAPAGRAATGASPHTPEDDPMTTVTAKMATAKTPPRSRPTASSSAMVVPAPAPAEEEVNTDAAAAIVPLSDPIPIADRLIEIAPLAIRPVVDREIQIPLIEPDRPQKGPGQTDKR